MTRLIMQPTESGQSFVPIQLESVPQTTASISTDVQHGQDDGVTLKCIANTDINISHPNYIKS